MSSARPDGSAFLSGPSYRFGDFEYNSERRELRKHGVRVRLQPQPLALLLALMESSGAVVSREELRARLWDSNTFVEFEQGLNSAIKRLRDVLCDSADSHRYIETAPGEGYRFVAQLESFTPARTAIVEPPQLVVLPAPAQLSSAHRGVWLWGGGLAIAAAIVLALVVWRHWPPPAERPLNFQPRDTVLISSFDNRTGESVFDGTLEYALERELTNSQFVSVASRDRINDTLALMRKPLNSRVDGALGREVCLRDGAMRAMITGRIEHLGPTYVLSAVLVDPTSGHSVSSFEEQADVQAAILPAVRRLSNEVRQALGERLSHIQQNNAALQKVTTPSLKALQLYSQASDEMHSGGSQAAAFELLRQAIADDPSFASAYILAAWSLRNQGKPSSEYLPYAKKALELSKHTSDSERYFIEGSYCHFNLPRQWKRAIAAYRALMEVDPEHPWGLHNLLVIYEDRDMDFEEGSLFVQMAKLRPNNADFNMTAGRYLERIQDPQEARPYLDRAKALIATPPDDSSVSGDPWMVLDPVYQAWGKDDIALARAEMRRAEPVLEGKFLIRGRQAIANFYLALGETRTANAWYLKTAEFAPNPDGDALVANARGDRSALRTALRSVSKEPLSPLPDFVSLMIREGLFREAEAGISSYMNDRGLNASDPPVKILRGQLYLAQGKNAQGMPLLAEGLRETRGVNDDSRLIAAPALAQAYLKEGRTASALEVLEDAASNRVSLYGWLVDGVPFWMQDEMALAQLYRRLGRVQDAERIESELRKLLAYADPDYPLLVELNRLENKPSLAANRN